MAHAIAAISTAPGRGGIGIVRVSGDDLGSFAQVLVGRPLTPRLATLATFREADGSAIDQGLALYFPAPHSYTGEDIVELQGHGGPAVLQLMLKRCLSLGARIAEPGEFTRRAFLNHKLDLVQAESVADLIEASSEHAARCAMRSLSGVFSEALQALRAQLIELRMLQEASFDFPEESIESLSLSAQGKRLERLRFEVAALQQRTQQGRLLREGLTVVLAGEPNVGKSSLLNALADDPVAIVSAVPGTTRDLVREWIQLAGLPVQIIDTAGLRQTDDPIEQLGIERTRSALKQADLVLWMVDACSGSEARLYETLAPLSAVPCWTIFNKVDLTDEAPHGKPPNFYLSALNGDGVAELKAALLEKAGWQPAEGVFLARERHVQALTALAEQLTAAEQQIETPEFSAEHLRLAQHTLNTLTGEFNADDLLGEIFSRFCIGK